nr:hypothetical protein [Tanacetum cinerariifolium]
MVVIWNPSIRKSVGIVLPPLHNSSLTTLGFGVCPSTFDPTIIMMSYSYWNFDTDNWQVNVFSLSSKTWKMIPSSNVPRGSVRITSSTQVATNRFVFWVACHMICANNRLSEHRSLILSFDLITQEFKEINLPHNLPNPLSVNFRISKLSESLVVSTSIDEVNGLVYGVWMLREEGGVMTSFKKLFNIKRPDDSAIGTVLGFTMSGEPIIETRKDNEQLLQSKFLYHFQRFSREKIMTAVQDLKLGMTDSKFNNENDPWEFSLDINDSDLHLTPVLHPSSSTRVEPSPSTLNPIRIIPGHAGIVQQANMLKENVFILNSDGALMSTQEYVQKVVDDTLKNEKLDQVVAIVKFCSPNVLDDLTVTMKDLSNAIPETIHYKVIGDDSYGNDITVRAALILANVLVFTPKPLMHYLNMTMRNVVKVFRKNTILESDSG